MSESIAPWSESEKRVMMQGARGRWRIYALLIVVSAVLAWLGMTDSWAQMPVGARWLSAAVAMFWLIVLASKLRYLHALRGDAALVPDEHVGPVHLVPVRRIGLFAPLGYELRSGNIRAVLGPDLPELASTSGLYRIRIAPRSRRLVAIEPAMAGLNRSVQSSQTRTEAGGCPDSVRPNQPLTSENQGSPLLACVDAEVVPRLPSNTGHTTELTDPTAGQLTSREQELLTALGKGWSDKQIARALGLTPATVRTYNSNLFKKLGIAGREAAATWANARGGTGIAEPDKASDET